MTLPKFGPRSSDSPSEHTMQNRGIADANQNAEGISFNRHIHLSGGGLERANRPRALIIAHNLNKTCDPYILRFPVEISSMIFEWHSTPEDPDDWRRNDAAMMTRSLTLASVCHGWREIALSTPQLWARLSFQRRINPISKQNSAEYLGMTKKFLELSKTLPLSFTLRKSHAKEEILVRLLDLLKNHWERWNTINIEDLQPDTEPLDLYSEELTPRILDSMRIIYNCHHRKSDFGVKQGNNPILVKHFITRGLPPSMIQISWQHLRKLDYAGLCSQEVCVLLGAAVQLEEAHFQRMVPSRVLGLDMDPSEKDAHAITNTCLRTLDLGSRLGWQASLQFLDDLSLPKLSFLTLSRFNDLKPLVTFWRRSECNLKFLSLHHCCHYGLIDILATAAPALKELQIHESSSIDVSDTLRELVRSSGINLEKLQLCIKGDFELWPEIVGLLPRAREGSTHSPVNSPPPGSHIQIQSLHICQDKTNRPPRRWEFEESLIDEECLQQMHFAMDHGFELRIDRVRGRKAEDLIKASDAYWASKHEQEIINQSEAAEKCWYVGWRSGAKRGGIQMGRGLSRGSTMKYSSALGSFGSEKN